MLDPKFKISGSGEVKAAASVFKDESAAGLAIKKGSEWKVRLGLDATQVWRVHILHIVSAKLEGYFSHITSHRLSLNMCSLLWRSLLYSTVPKTLLMHDCGRLGVSVRRSTVCQEKTQNRLLACRSISRKRCSAVLPRVTSVRALGKEVAIDEKLQRRVQSGHSVLFCRCLLELSVAASENKGEGNQV